jgi:hypothetical protein
VKPKKPKSHKKTKKRQPKETKKALDALSGSGTNPKKSNRGRKRSLPWSTVTGRASNYEFQLGKVWHKLGIPLLAATTEEEVTKVFDQFGQPYARDFVPGFSSDIIFLLKDKDFPQRPVPRIKFLARSLAGRSTLSFRSSRDICEAEARREKSKSPHRILRREFFIECSCGYKGPALGNDCPDCGAQPQMSLVDWTGRALELPEVKPKKKKTIKTAEPEIHEEIVTAAPDPRTVRCECGAAIFAASRETAMEALAKHKREEHGEVIDQQTEKPPE